MSAVTKLAQASRLLLQASDLLSEASAFGDRRGASIELLAPTLSKLNDAFSYIASKDIASARKRLTESKQLLNELKAKMPKHPKARIQ